MSATDTDFEFLLSMYGKMIHVNNALEQNNVDNNQAETTSRAALHKPLYSMKEKNCNPFGLPISLIRNKSVNLVIPKKFFNIS